MPMPLMDTALAPQEAILENPQTRKPAKGGLAA